MFKELNNMIHGDIISHQKEIQKISNEVKKIQQQIVDYEKEIEVLNAENKKTKKKRTGVTSLFTHSKVALKNASKIVYLNPKERNIIVSHMFPLGIHLPQYMESWIVQGVDKVVGTYEFIEKICAEMYTKKEYIRELIRQN